jgi:hypothetical protein
MYPTSVSEIPIFLSIGLPNYHLDQVRWDELEGHLAKDSVRGKDVTAHIFKFVCYLLCYYNGFNDVCLSGIPQTLLSPTQPVTQVKSQRLDSECVPGSDLVLPQGAEQEKVK